MKLILSGGWLQKRGIFEAHIKKVHFLSSLKDLKDATLGFLVLSYHLSSQTLNLHLKESSYPKAILLEIGGFSPFNRKPEDTSLKFLTSSLDDKAYVERVKKVKEFISEGVIYQLNLTCRFDFHLDGEPVDLFLRYYRAQPVPYAFFLDLEDFYLISGSMELFLKKEGNRLVSKPIKGTAKRRKDLEESQKDKAENLMITDMVRNDLSAVAIPGSVRVEELFKIERFRTLFQMHSCVVAETRESIQRILEETFPPASVVGAPKRKAVEIIDLLEPHNREYYCGCAGLIIGEDFTLSVLIRTAMGHGGRLSYYAGAGILWDSVPEREWQEVLLKTKAFYSLK
ncbi:MAG: chorismate-binding protein [Aquificaceae bacterium]